MRKPFVGILVLVAVYWVSLHFGGPREPHALNGLALIVAVPTIYFLPALVAWARGHHATLAVFLTNLLLGWTFLGWVAALVWSVMPVANSQELVL